MSVACNFRKNLSVTEVFSHDFGQLFEAVKVIKQQEKFKKSAIFLEIFDSKTPKNTLKGSKLALTFDKFTISITNSIKKWLCSM